MIQAVLSKGQHPEYGVISIPLRIPREEYDHVMELLVPLEIGNPVARDCHMKKSAAIFWC